MDDQEIQAGEMIDMSERYHCVTQLQDDSWEYRLKCPEDAEREDDLVSWAECLRAQRLAEARLKMWQSERHARGYAEDRCRAYLEALDQIVALLPPEFAEKLEDKANAIVRKALAIPPGQRVVPGDRILFSVAPLRQIADDPDPVPVRVTGIQPGEGDTKVLVLSLLRDDVWAHPLLGIIP